MHKQIKLVNRVNRKSLFPLYWKSTFLTAPESLPCQVKHGKDYSQVSASLIPPQHIYEIAEYIPQLHIEGKIIQHMTIIQHIEGKITAQLKSI